MKLRNRTSLAIATLLTVSLSAPVWAQSAQTDKPMDHAGMQHSDAMPPDKSDQPGTDTWITTKVKADLLASKGVSGTDVSVETKDGVVWLSGTAATKAEKDRTVAKAKAIEGVKSVNATKLRVVAATKK